MLFLSACGNDDDEPNPDKPDAGGASALVSTIMEPTELFKATKLVVSENGQYIVLGLDTRIDGSNANYKFYFSKDTGESFSELSGTSDFTAVSNNGILLSGYKLKNLNDNSDQQIPQISYSPEPVMDVNGVAYYVNGTIHKFENGQSINLGIAVNALLGEMIYSNGKIGFLSLYYRTLAEYDIATNTLTSRLWPAFDERRLRGTSANNNNKAKLSYNEGYFGYASAGAAVVVAPNDQITYYDYPSTYDYQDNPIAVMVEDGKMYVDLYENPLRTGNYNTVVKTTFEASGSTLTKTDIAFPRTAKVNGTVYYSGFIEGGKYRDYGIVKSTASGKEYVNTKVNFDNKYSNTGFVMEVGDHLYFRNKKYDTSAKTYQSSEFKNLLYGYADAQKTVAYTGEGTFSTTNNGSSWKLENANGIAPNFVIKNNKGGYYALIYNEYYYVPSGTGFQYSKFDMAVYSSSDAYNWQLISEHKNVDGMAPKAISPEGHLVYLENRNPMGNPDFVSNLSTDEGISFKSFKNEVAGAVSYVGTYSSYHKMASGRHVAFTYQNPNFIAISCTGLTDGCSEQQVMAAEVPSGVFKVFYNSNDEAIIGGKTVFKITGL
ncbi:hypothetical protein AWN68_08295 [Roseivirga echinicomitans]|uniref:Uncharacterized protein n=1 Tax=Roseivirga echinicomitans TaxID=296218 RepID=A0A150X1T8_9BACT|nr:hypothetical protein AWN68_08295 [Roseivirga echinicomitans]